MKLTINFYDFTEFPQDWIDSIPEQGAADTAISQIMMHNIVKCDRKSAIDYLVDIGFDSEELAEDSDETLTSRILWLALLDCRENETNECYLGV